ncbi:MAG: hypothetical protein PUC71_06765 [Oscillospiraceae bacterium]|nr:hypothetical protein [Oscillospiraceae bacterium]
MKSMLKRLLSAVLACTLLCALALPAGSAPVLPKKIQSSKGYSWTYTLNGQELRIRCHDRKTWSEVGAPFNEYYGRGYNLPFLMESDRQMQSVMLSCDGSYPDELVLGLSELVRSGTINRIVYDDSVGYNYVLLFETAGGRTLHGTLRYQQQEIQASYRYDTLGHLIAIQYASQSQDGTSREWTDRYYWNPLGLLNAVERDGKMIYCENAYGRVSQTTGNSGTTTISYRNGVPEAIVTTGSKATESYCFSFANGRISKVSSGVVLPDASDGEVYTFTY